MASARTARPSRRLVGTVVTASLGLASLVGAALVRPAQAVAPAATRTPSAAAVVDREPARPNPRIAPAAAPVRPGFGPGASGSGVREVQRRLRVSPVTGFFGPATRAAVARFQASTRLPADGWVDWTTYQRIMRLPVPKAAAAPTATATAAARSSASASRSRTRTVPSGAMVCPAPGARFTDDFGDPRSGGRSHQGIDLLGRRGQPLLAIESGVVVRAKVSTLGGLSVTLQGRSGAKYFYTHNDRNLVVTGQRVTAGQTIALMGDSGNAKGTVHLHFEWWRSGAEGAAVNPYPLLRSLC